MKAIIFSTIMMFNILFLQSMNYNQYVNLRIGNIFIYGCTEWRAVPPSFGCDAVYRLKVTITDTVSYSGKKYYSYTKQLLLVSGSGTCTFSPFMFPFYVGSFSTIRIDSVNGKLFYYNPQSGCNNETMLDSLGSNINDIVGVNCVPSPYAYKCIDTTNRRKYDSQSIPFSNSRKIRDFEYQVGLIDNYYYLLQGGSQGRSQQTLIGRVVNGIVYGDTSMSLVNISQINSGIPNRLKLSQNYPNPFNPVTNIKFDISQTGFVKLIVYDLLGKEVSMLVNKQLSPGTYNADFDAGSLPSGVYYYMLESGSYIETKKMVLIK